MLKTIDRFSVTYPKNYKPNSECITVLSSPRIDTIQQKSCVILTLSFWNCWLKFKNWSDVIFKMIISTQCNIYHSRFTVIHRLGSWIFERSHIMCSPVYLNVGHKINTLPLDLCLGNFYAFYYVFVFLQIGCSLYLDHLAQLNELIRWV